MHTTVLSVALLDVADAHHQLFDGDRLLVLKLVALSLQARVVDQNVGIGGDTGHRDAERGKDQEQDDIDIRRLNQQLRMFIGLGMQT